LPDRNAELEELRGRFRTFRGKTLEEIGKEVPAAPVGEQSRAMVIDNEGTVADVPISAMAGSYEHKRDPVRPRRR
jgi:hypothetical protein